MKVLKALNAWIALTAGLPVAFLVFNPPAALLIASRALAAGRTSQPQPGPVADDPPPNTRGRSAGSRGCGTAARSAPGPAIVLLAPNEVEKTISTQPVLAWYSRDGRASTPVVFRLYERNDDTQTYRLLLESESETLQGRAGILTLTVPGPGETLSVGQRYLWQVELVCDRSRPSGNLFAEAELEVVAPTVELAAELAAATTAAEKIRILAAEELWYDALAAAISPENLPENLAESLPAGPIAPAPARARSLLQTLLGRVAVSAEEQRRLENSPLYWAEVE